MSTTFTEYRNETFYVVRCYTCGNPFGVTEALHRRAVTDKEGSLFCPACGEQTKWVGKTEEQKKIEHLERKLAWEAEESRRQRDLKEKAQRKLTATRGVVTHA